MCVKPIILKNQVDKLTGVNKYTQPVPCGQCPECKKAKVNSWLFRIGYELQRSENPLFITLTYRNDELTYTNSEQPTLVKRDLQLFFKRLRKKYEKIYPNAKKIKYYAVGEYGSRTKRPHYHIIMFNLLDSSMVSDTWGLGFTLSLPLS